MLADETRARLNRSPQPIRDGGTCMGVIQGIPRMYCSRNGTVERDGKLYCRQHDPGDDEEYRLKRMAEYAAQEARLEAEFVRSRRRELEEKACSNLTDDELRRIIEAGGMSR